MNIFYVHDDPKVSATMLCDKHCVKMILESAQMLSTAHRLLDDSDAPVYKATHKNHPSAIWVRQSHQHYEWLLDHALALCEEYTRRYGRTHKTEAMLRTYLIEPPRHIPAKCFLEPPQCMPDIYKRSTAVEAYRAYYIGDKAKIATWKAPATVPDWFILT